MNDEANAEPTQNFDPEAVRRVISLASRLQSQRSDLVSRAELEEIARELGLSRQNVADAIDSLTRKPRGLLERITARFSRHQSTAVFSGGILGAAAAAFALLAPTALPLSLLTLLGLVCTESTFAFYLSGKHRHATFQAANFATWAGWSMSCALLNLPLAAEVGVYASAAAAIIGSSVLALRARDEKNNSGTFTSDHGPNRHDIIESSDSGNVVSFRSLRVQMA